MAVLAITGAAALLAPLPGCQQRGRIVREEVVRVDEGLVLPGPFAPKAMRVHPLTHAEIDAQGQARVIVHVELKDAWGDTVKGIGRVQAQLWSEGAGPGDAERWDVDLRALSENATFYDPATRTYRIVLGGLPAWMQSAIRSGEGPGGRLRVLFLTSEVDGTAVVLRDEFVVRP